MRVFISWSGERSRIVADAWRRFLPDVLQSVHAFVSHHDIEAGELWGERLDAELAETDIGILCLTPENLTAPWLHYEAGALAKKVTTARVCTFLFDLKFEEIKFPLARFNHVSATIDGARRIVTTVNSSLGANRMSPDRLSRVFDKFWPDFETDLKSVPPAAPQPVPLRGSEDMIAEILQILRQKPLNSQPMPSSEQRQLSLPQIGYAITEASSFGALIHLAKLAARTALMMGRSDYCESITSALSSEAELDAVKKSLLMEVARLDRAIRAVPDEL